jgi:hypothetical protein
MFPKQRDTLQSEDLLLPTTVVTCNRISDFFVLINNLQIQLLTCNLVLRTFMRLFL